MSKLNSFVKLTLSVIFCASIAGDRVSALDTLNVPSYSEIESLRIAATTPEEMQKVIGFHKMLMAEGEGRSALRLGNIFSRGEIVAVDPDTGLFYYQKAYDLGYGPALKSLTNSLIRAGRGEEAYAVFDQADSDDLRGTEFNQARAHVRGEFGKFSDPQIGENLLMGLITDTDNRRARLELARYYAFEDSMNVNSAKSVDLLAPLVEQQDPDALILLAQQYTRGKGVEIDLERAIELFAQAVDAGANKALLYKADAEVDAGKPDAAMATYQIAVAESVPSSELYLALAHIRGDFGENSDVSIGETILQELTEEKADGQAQLELAKVYSNIRFGTTDFDKSRELLEPLVENGDAAAFEQLARLYRSGLGVARDYDRAIELYHAAAKAGNSRALLNAAQLEMRRGKWNDARASMSEAISQGVSGAELEYARALVRNSFRKFSDRADGVALLNKGVAEGSIDYVIASLNLLSEGRQIVMDHAELMRLAELEADQGNTYAAEALIRFTRKRSRLLSDAWDRRTNYLKQYDSILSEGFRTEETIRYKISELGPIKVRPSLMEMLDGLTSSQYYTALVSIARADKNAYTYILQETLSDLGYNPGSATGRLNSSTLRAINAFCDNQGYKEQCLHGALGGTTVQMMAASLAQLKKG